MPEIIRKLADHDIPMRPCIRNCGKQKNMMDLTAIISDALAAEVIGLLEKLNGNNKYWDSLYWEFYEDAAQLFIRVLRMDHQNNPEKSRLLRAFSDQYYPRYCHPTRIGFHGAQQLCMKVSTLEG